VSEVRIRTPVIGDPVVVVLSGTHQCPGLVRRHLGGGRCSVDYFGGMNIATRTLPHRALGEYPHWHYPEVEPTHLTEVER
jgi:hypothetical protein